ncbi:MAG TPA: glycosyltransferase family 39 protein [Blastocatellia bacterium]|nr:glycosyltransferase family 39 protein [Blastocatellia bacterium]
MGYRRKRISQSAKGAAKRRVPEQAWAALDRAARWRFTGLVAAGVYMIVAGAIIFTYHRILDYGMESDFLFEYVPVAREMANLKLPIPAFRGPFYPALLAGVAGIVRDYFRAGLLIGLGSAGAAIVLSFYLIRRVFGGRIALGATLLLIANPYFFLYTYQVGTDLPFVALATASIYLLLGRDDLSWKRVAGSAALGALAYLTRYNGLFLLAAPLLVAVFNLWKVDWRPRVMAGALFVAVFFACIAPWGFYCLREKGSFFYSENYQNIAFDVYAKGQMTREDFFWKGNPFEGMSIKALVMHDPRTFFGSLARNFVSHGARILGDLLGWPLAALSVAGLVLLVIQRPSPGQCVYLLLNLAFYLVLLPIHLEIRYALFMLGALVSLSSCAFFLLNTRVRAPALQIASVLAFTGLVIWSIASSYKLNQQAIDAGPPEVVQIADRFRSSVPPERRGNIVAARKPHIAYYTGLGYFPLPVVDSPDELIRRLKAQNVDYLYFGRAEYALRPGLRALMDPNRTWPGLTRVVRSDDPPSFLYRVE